MIAPPRPPAQDELEALIKEARARQLRRRLLGAAGVAIAVAIGLGLYAVIAGGTSGSTSGNSSNRSTAAPSCRSTQLAAQTNFEGGGGQPILGGGVMIYNTSRSKCSLPQRAPVVLLSSGNRQVPIKQFFNPGLDENVQTAPLLAHHQVGEVHVLWSNWCANPATVMTLRFGHGVQVTARVNTQPSCNNRAYRTKFSTGRTLTRRS
jgi:hypothetical protein